MERKDAVQGLIYNLLSALAERAGCQEEAWEVALAAAYPADEDLEERLLDALDPAPDGAEDALLGPWRLPSRPRRPN